MDVVKEMNRRTSDATGKSFMLISNYYTATALATLGQKITTSSLSVPSSLSDMLTEWENGPGSN